MGKRCNRCGQHKDYTQFTKAPSNKDGHINQCKPCKVIMLREYGRTHKGWATLVYNNQIRSSKDRGHQPPSYSREELLAWALSAGLNSLMDSWKYSGYLKNLRPSVDRLDDAQGYTLNNIQLVVWAENNEKMYTNRKNCSRITKQNRQIVQQDLRGNSVALFDSLAMASRLTGTTRTNISRAANPNTTSKTAGGFRWSYV